jgi:predicted ATPase
MISHFEVSNFKSLKHLGLDMRQFMVLVGPNGAGKTNLVRALEVLGEVLRRGTVEPIQEHGYDQLIRREKKPARGGLWFMLRTELTPQEMDSWFGHDLVSDWLPAETEESRGVITLEAGVGVAGSIHDDEVNVSSERIRLRSAISTLELVRDATGHLHVEPGTDSFLWWLAFQDELLTLEIESMGKNSTPRAQEKRLRALVHKSFARDSGGHVDPRLLRIVNWQRRPSLLMQYLRDISQVTRLRLDASALRKDASFEESRESLLGPTGEGLASAVAKLRGTKATPSAAFRKVLEALQEVYPRIEDVTARRIPPGRLMLLFKERGISEELGQGSISDGVLHALALLVALNPGADDLPGLLAIEEPENAIHPWPLRKLIARAQESSRQVLLTTHSETAINAVTDPETLFVVENDDKHGTTVTPAIEREAALKSILEESGQRLGDIWMDGTLGGVPGEPS